MPNVRILTFKPNLVKSNHEDTTQNPSLSVINQSQGPKSTPNPSGGEGQHARRPSPVGGEGRRCSTVPLAWEITPGGTLHRGSDRTIVRRPDGPHRANPTRMI